MRKPWNKRYPRLNTCGSTESFLVSIRKPKFSPPPLRGRDRVGVIMAQNFNTFHFNSPHPGPLPQGEREFPDENYLAKVCSL
jgi:hypothetical protein